MKDIVNILIEKGKIISVMESCTGGAIANAITNIEGSSEIFKFGAVTYSNEYKIKMGVSEDIINKYTVYSAETAKEMARAISDFANSDYSIGITGKLGVPDPKNSYGNDNIVYISIYDRNKKMYYNYTYNIENASRIESKAAIVDFICLKLKEIL